MITWSRLITRSRLAGMKFCPALPRFRQCYKFFINYILRLHVKRFIATIRDPSYLQLGSRFVRTKFCHLIASARLGGIKQLSIQVIHRSTFQKIKDISIAFLRLICCHSARKKANKYFCRISSLYRSSHWKCSAKTVFLKILYYSQENTCVGVSLQDFKSVLSSKRDSSDDVFLWILRKL